MPNAKEVTELISFVRAAGFRVSKSGNQKHWKVMHKNGSAVIDANGPLIISTTPSEHRFREMTVKRLMGAGVLKQDPYKKTKTGPQEAGTNGGRARSTSHLKDPAVQAAKVARIKEISREFHERTVKLRSRIEPIIAKLGGWSAGRGPQGQGSGVRIAEFGEVLMYWGDTRNIVETPSDSKTGQPPNKDAVTQAMRNLMKKDGTLGRTWLPIVERFTDDLEDRAGTPPRPERAAERYRELYREMRGISLVTDRPPKALETAVRIRQRPPDLEAAAAYLESQREAPEPEHEQVGPLYQPQAPSIAMQAVFLMARGAATEDMETIVKLGEQIARLEMGK